MSIMLANQYFMGRNFGEAEQLFENIVKADSSDFIAQKKLIICYTETGKISEAHKLFNDMITDNITVITTTDLIKDDCPCPEIIERINLLENNFPDTVQLHIKLGILWLYCDAEKSLAEFQSAFSADPKNSMCSYSIMKIKQYLQTA